MKELNFWAALQIFTPLIVTLFAILAYYHMPGLIDAECSSCFVFEVTQYPR